MRIKPISLEESPAFATPDHCNGPGATARSGLQLGLDAIQQRPRQLLVPKHPHPDADPSQLLADDVLPHREALVRHVAHYGHGEQRVLGLAKPDELQFLNRAIHGPIGLIKVTAEGGLQFTLEESDRAGAGPEGHNGNATGTQTSEGGQERGGEAPSEAGGEGFIAPARPA